MPDSILVFDMDGVLVDVRESYREAIAHTVEHFTGRRITREQIQQYKNAGGWNNDWALSQRISADLGVEVSYETVVEYFQSIFLGQEGLIYRERWVAGPGLLERLGERYQLAIFTGRERAEAEITLRRSAGGVKFDPVITTDDVRNGKPAPDGLHRIAELLPGRRMWYVGDTVDDARASSAARVPFIGIAGGAVELEALLKREGAVAVLDDINQLETVLP